MPAKAPYWLTIPERGLSTGIAILGAVGSGKSSCCMYPFAEQIREEIGGRGRDRTGDPLLAKQVLSQLSYTPIVRFTLILKHFPS